MYLSRDQEIQIIAALQRAVLSAPPIEAAKANAPIDRHRKRRFKVIEGGRTD